MKILVAGNVNGKFKPLFDRVRSVVKKTGPFDLMLCAGAFFDGSSECRQQWQLLKSGEITVPLPTYILGPVSAETTEYYSDMNCSGGELCDNVTCLGQKGIYTTAEGLKIAYLSGYYSQADYQEQVPPAENAFRPTFNREDICFLCRQQEPTGVDILLTSEWPKGVQRLVTSPVGLTGAVGSTALSQVAALMRPRYHFTARIQQFYERPPYRNVPVSEGASALHPTRFISLADVGNPDKKARYLYAFVLTPMKHADPKVLSQLPDGTTESPYRQPGGRREGDKGGMTDGASSLAGSGGFFFDQEVIAESRKRQQKQQHHQDRFVPSAKRHPAPKPQRPCWFCLGSPDVEKHLIIAIGDHSYLALGKGGLVDEHCLILPIGHYANSLDTPQEVSKEMDRFKEALRKYFHSKHLSCVIYERNWRTQHLQQQIIPVPETEPAALRQAFIDHGRRIKLEFTEVPRGSDLTQVVGPAQAYFLAEFDEGPSLIARIRGDFPLNFGREVLASPLLLNLPARVDWRACSLSKEEEIKLVEKFRDKFAPFDFTDADEDNDDH